MSRLRWIGIAVVLASLNGRPGAAWQLKPGTDLVGRRVVKYRGPLPQAGVDAGPGERSSEVFDPLMPVTDGAKTLAERLKAVPDIPKGVVDPFAPVPDRTTPPVERVAPLPADVDSAVFGLLTFGTVDRAEGSWIRIEAEGDAVGGWCRVDEVLPIEEAVAFFGDKIRANPRDVGVLVDRAEVYLATKEVEKALTDLDQAIKADPKLARAFFVRGHAQQAADQVDGAIDDYTELIRLRPKDFLGYRERAEARASLGQYDLAIDDYTEVIRLEPAWAWAFAKRGYYRAQQDDTEGALADWEQALRLNPNDSSALLNRGVARLRLKDYDRALADFEAVQRLPAFDPNLLIPAWEGEADYWLWKKDYERALRLYSNLVQLEPENPRYLMKRATASYKKGDKAKAIDDLEEAVRLQPDDPSVLCDRAVIWMNLKEFDRAIADYGQIIRGDPGSASVYTARGWAHLASKQFESGLRGRGRGSPARSQFPSTPVCSLPRFHQRPEGRSTRQSPRIRVRSRSIRSEASSTRTAPISPGTAESSRKAFATWRGRRLRSRTTRTSSSLAPPSWRSAPTRSTGTATAPSVSRGEFARRRTGTTRRAYATFNVCLGRELDTCDDGRVGKRGLTNSMTVSTRIFVGRQALEPLLDQIPHRFKVESSEARPSVGSTRG